MFFCHEYASFSQLNANLTCFYHLLIMFVIGPSMPTDIEIRNISSTIVEIKWHKPLEPNGALLGYKLSYKKQSEVNFSDVHVHNNVFGVNLTQLGMCYLNTMLIHI